MPWIALASLRNAAIVSSSCQNLETLLECGFVDAYRHLYPAATGSYTWWSNRLNKRDENRGWRLDYFFVSENMSGRIQNVTHLSNVMGSDHCPTGFSPNSSQRNDLNASSHWIRIWCLIRFFCEFGAYEFTTNLSENSVVSTRNGIM